jgi:hypothetical protein
MQQLIIYRDVIFGFQLQLHRCQAHNCNLTTVTLQKRIDATKNKLVELTAKGGVPKEIEKLGQMLEQVLNV